MAGLGSARRFHARDPGFGRGFLCSLQKRIKPLARQKPRALEPADRPRGARGGPPGRGATPGARAGSELAFGGHLVDTPSRSCSPLGPTERSVRRELRPATVRCF